MVTIAERSIDGVSVGARLTPGSADELAETLQAADSAGQVVAPIGGGTQLDLGMPPARVDIGLETTALHGVVDYEPADLTVTVEAGMRFAELQRLLGDQGQFLALDPSAEATATIGGLVATNASGPLRFSSGTARDLVIGTRVANPDGTLTRAGGRVVKNVAGYDLNKLYIGSLGTLGVIVELSFKLAPVPPATACVVGQFGDLDSARTVIATVIRSSLSPLAIELLGPGPAALAAGVDSGYGLAFSVGGYPLTVARQQRDLTALIRAHRGEALEASETTWSDLAALRLAARGRALVLKASAPLSASAVLVQILSRGLDGLGPVVWAHAGSGVAYAAADAPGSPDLLHQLRSEVEVLGSNASLVIQRCPTALKAGIDVWGDPGSSVALMRALKQQLDPNRTLNRGRYVGGI
jgi:glycolate oxidase FAD binding subunit